MPEETEQSNHAKPDRPPVVLVASGLDPTASAGLLADVRVLTSLGCHPCGVVTCETVQSSYGLRGIRASDPEVFYEQLHALIEDFTFSAVKIGALSSVEIIEVLGRELKNLPDVPVVLDPIFAPTIGGAFLDKDGMRAMSAELLGQTLIATPNISELGAPADLIIEQDDDEMIIGCASGWLDAGVETVLVTGLERDGKMVDRLIRLDAESHVIVDDFSHPAHCVGNVHGTGCILASAIAGHLAMGEKLVDAVQKSSELASDLIRRSLQIGGGSAFWTIG